MAASVSSALVALLLGISAVVIADRMVGGRHPEIPKITREALVRARPEVAHTLALIARDGPFPFAQDDTVYTNVQGYLPPLKRDGYREYTVITPGAPDRGARRLVTGGPRGRAPREFTWLYYTDDHYSTFWFVR